MDTCASCGAVNRGEAAFCASCGSSLGRACPSCGTVAARPAHFCDHCGAPLGGPTTSAGPLQSRKVVTVLFADLSGSTGTQEQMDPEAVRRWMDHYYAAMRSEIERHGGRLVKVIGDGVMAVFGVPDVREDDARRAIEAAVAMQRAFDDLDGGSNLRIGINTGEVVVTADHDDVVGDTVNVAARLEQAAGAGEVLVGEATFRLVRLTAQLRALPPLDLKGKAEPVQAFRLVTLAPVEDTATASPFIGRQVELGRLLTVLDDAIKSSRARLVTIVGSPGVGKTRLARELAAVAADRARVVEMRCDPAGGATFAPIAEALRIAASIDDDASEEAIVAHLTAVLEEEEPDRDRIGVVAGALLGAGEPGQPEETFWAVRRLVENAGRRRPIVLFFDDVHWAEPLLLDLIDNLVEWIREAAVLVVMTARPELREQRPSLVEEGGRLSASIHLEGLGSDDSRRLACELLDADSLPDVLLERLVAASEGNPLFVGELLRMLVDDGVLRREEGAWTATVDLAELDVPLTIHAVLSARIDRLDHTEREVLETASVMGKTFYRGAVAAMVGPAVRDDLDATLERLRRKELVEPAGTYWIDEPVHRFHHVLIRDAAYRRLLKDARAALHDGVATWLEGKVGDAIEHDDLIGYQLEQAYLLRNELGQHDALVGGRAAERLAAAGRRALEADDCVSAAALLGRALECLDPGDPRVAGLLIDRCEALLTAGNVTEAMPAIERLAHVATPPDRLKGWGACFSAEIANLTSTGSLTTAIDQTADAAVRFAALGDAAGEAKAHAVRAASLARLGRIGDCEAALDLALGAARRAGDRRRATAVLAGAPVAALWGPNPVTRASGRCLDVVRVLRITSRSPAVEATSLRCQAVLESLRGRSDAARRMLASARQSLEDLGNAPGLLELDVATGMVEQLAGELPIAEDHLRRARAGFLSLGIDADAAFAAALLADVLVARGRVEEALSLTEESERLGGEDLRTAIAWRSVRAIALLGRGDAEDARRLANEAVELAESTDALIDHAKALVALAAALRSSGDEPGARARARRALELYERKEATILAAQVQTFLGGDAASPDPGIHDEPRQPSAPLRRNAASRLLLRLREASLAAAWREVAANLAPDVLLRDRRPLLGAETSGVEGFVEHVQAIMALGVDSTEQTMAMVRGDRLLLETSVWRGSAGDVEVEVVSLLELDAEGRVAIVDLYDSDQVREATLELDRRFLADEGALLAGVVRPATQWLAGILLRDWELLRAALHDDFVGVDHRPLGWGTVGPDDFTELYRSAVRLAPDVWGGFFELHEVSDRGVCGHAELDGTTVEGAEFRTTATAVVFATDGKIARVEFFPVDQPERGLARLRGTGDAEVSNAAGRAHSTMIRAAMSGDWEPASALLADDVVIQDHRQLVGVDTVGRETWVDSVRSAVIPGSRAEPRTLAIRGDHLALLQVRYLSPPDIAVDGLHVARLDEHGQIAQVDTYDLEQIDDAFEALDEHHLAGLAPAEGAVWRTVLRMANAVVQASSEGLRAHVTPDFQMVDHRPASMGTIGVEDWLQLFPPLLEVTADVRYRIVADFGVASHGSLTHIEVRGTRDGGEFVTSYVAAWEMEGDLVARVDVFPLDQLDAAQARFGELGAARALENRATRVWSSACAASVHGRWDEMRRLHSDDVATRDHRALVGGFETLGVDPLIELTRSVLDIGVTTVLTSVEATRGDQLCLAAVTWRGGESETGARNVIELDGDGRICRVDAFDADRIEDAVTLLDERFLAHEGGGSTIWRCMSAAFRAMNERDFDRYRQTLDDEFEIVDHRPLSFGTIDADAYVEASQALINQSHDVRWMIAREHGVTDHIACGLADVSGTSEYGSEFTNLIWIVSEERDGRWRRLETFGNYDAMKARFDELTSPGTMAPANEASGAFDAWIDASDDIERWAAWCSADIVLCDHRPVVGAGLEHVGREAAIEAVEGIHKVGARPARWTHLAVRGQRLALSRLLMVGGAGEVEVLQVVETADDGRIARTDTFEVGQIDEAFALLDERFLQGDGQHSTAWRLTLETFDAMNAREWVRARAALADGLAVDDRRPLSLGAVHADAYIAASRALVDQAADVRWVIAADLGVTDRCACALGTLSGTSDQGGSFTTPVWFVMEDRGGGLAATLFPARDEATAYFEALE